MSAQAERTCALAGCEVSFTPYRGTQKYCSSRHSIKARNDARYTPVEEMPVVACAYCGKEFRADRRNRKYCSKRCYEKMRWRPERGEEMGGGAMAAVAGADLSDEQLAIMLQRRGFRVTKAAPQETRIRLAPKKARRHRVGVVSDTHMGSKYQQLTYLHEFYDLCEKEGIETVLHAGDLVHGSHKMHRDMVLESFVHGADAQIEYAVRHYPRKPGITTYLIAGNHDTSFWEDSGVDVVRAFCEARDDAKYLGRRGAYLEFGGLNVYLWHPRGGGSYALSYKLQKWIEQVAPDQKPHIVLTGHWHSPAHVVAYRNVEGIRLPCYQTQTPFEKTLGLHPVVGGLILDLWTSDDGLEDMQTRWVVRRVHALNDY